jgi:Brp/Blh family beta-carotene 15,15'-monooxygenase
MLNKIRIHQFFYFAVSLFIIFISQKISSFNISEINSSISVLFLIIMSFGVSHGAADSIIIWKTFPKLKIRVLAFLIYLLIVLLGLFLWFKSPLFGLIILLCISIIHFGQSDLSYLKHANEGIKISWGFAMTLLPIIFFESDVKSIFDTLVNIDIDTRIFVFLRKITILFILSFLFFLYRSYAIAKKDKFFLGLEFLITLVLANFLPPLYWFTFYFCFLHGIRALINIGINSSRDFLFLIIFTLPVTFFAYFMLFENLNFEYLNVIFSVLMSLTISHMLLPLLNRLLSRSFN